VWPSPCSREVVLSRTQDDLKIERTPQRARSTTLRLIGRLESECLGALKTRSSIAVSSRIRTSRLALVEHSAFVKLKYSVKIWLFQSQREGDAMAIRYAVDLIDTERVAYERLSQRTRPREVRSLTTYIFTQGR